jgi:ketosteroid isomerase-like protein
MSTETSTTTESARSFEEFMKERQDASDAFVNGNVDPLLKISTTTPPASIFGPAGTCIEEPSEVNLANEAGSQLFEPGGENRFEVMHSAADGDLAYWAGLQRSVVKMRGGEQPVSMDLRITEIFRREGGGWKLIHRHADELQKPRTE